MREKILLQILAFVFLVLPLKGFSASTLKINELGFLSVNSAITPATYDYLKQNFKSLPKNTLIILKMNTPGGLVSTTKDIITMAAREKRPFVIWITPEGASAASAGSIIASAAHFLFMSPGTNIGAATPVGLGEDIKESDGRKKAMNDLRAMVRSLSTSRGRPAEPFEKMILEAESYTSSESLKLGIIDGVVSNQDEMLTKLNDKSIIIDGVKTQLVVSENVLSKNYEPTLGQRILEVIANPSTAYILFLIGVALIYFEFQAPGGFIAGTIGVCLLILAGIAFQVLPLDWGSMGLIIAGIFLLVLELYVVSYGLLGLAGVTAFVLGSLFLFHGDTGFISVQYNVILSALAGVLITSGVIIWFLWKEKKKQSNNDFFLPLGATGTILSKMNDQEYQVKVRGEIWRAFADEKLQVNDSVHITEVDANKLTIKIKRNS